METYKRFYKGIFSGQQKKNLRINRYSQEEVLTGIMEYIPKNDEGVLEIQEIDFKTKERKTVKKVIIVNELEFAPQTEIPINL
jgi:hypothetical protein